MNDNNLDYNNFPAKKFSYFFLLFFLVNIFISIFLALSIFSVLQGLISLIIIVFLSSYFILYRDKNLSENFNFFLIIYLPIIFWSFFYFPALNSNDDLPAYLVFLEKTATMGSLPIEPLSYRRMLSLGGLYPLQGSVSFFDLKYLSIIEPSLGILLTSTAIIILNNNFYSKLISIFLLCLTPLLGSRVLANTGGVFILVFFSYINLFFFYHLVKLKDYRKKQYLIIIPILCIALSLAIKPIPFVFNFLIFFFLIIYLLVFNKLNIKFGYFILIGIFFSLIYLYPFLKYSYLSSGTLVYPFLGEGWKTLSELSSQRFNLNYKLPNLNDFLEILFIYGRDPFFIFTLLLIGFLIKRKNNFYLCFSILISYLVFYTIIVLTAGDKEMIDDLNSFPILVGKYSVPISFRYTFPISLSIILLFINLFFENINFNIKKKLASKISIFFLLSILFFTWSLWGNEVNKNRKKIINSFDDNNLNVSLKEISYIKEDKILVRSYYAINLYKKGFKNMVIFDTPYEMVPWFYKKNKSEKNKLIKSGTTYTEDFYTYLSRKNIKYIITDLDVNNSNFLSFLKNKTYLVSNLNSKYFYLYRIK